MIIKDEYELVTLSILSSSIAMYASIDGKDAHLYYTNRRNPVMLIGSLIHVNPYNDRHSLFIQSLHNAKSSVTEIKRKAYRLSFHFNSALYSALRRSIQEYTRNRSQGVYMPLNYVACDGCGLDFPPVLVQKMNNMQGVYCPCCRHYTRTCSACHITYPAHNRYFSTNGDKGLRSTCRHCHGEQVRAIHRRHRIADKNKLEDEEYLDND